MAGLDDLTAQSIGGPNQFNWPWFIELCVCGVLAIFFLFYFNRLFATLLSYGIRAYAWHHYRVWVDIQALQISLLGGRIFFKGFRYHGENETIFVHNGYITWRYWFRHVRHVDLDNTQKEQGDDETISTSTGPSDTSSRAPAGRDEESGVGARNATSEARVAVFVSGVEWFIYNRTTLYDAILHNDVDAKEQRATTESSSTGRTSSDALKVQIRSKFRKQRKSTESSCGESSKLKFSDSGINGISEPIARQSTTASSTPAESEVTALQSLLIQLFPIHIECARAAISIGNEHTRAILVTTIEKAKGHIDARGCGPHDLFRQLFEFNIDHPVVQMRPNPDFVGTQISVAEHLITEAGAGTNKKRWWRWHMDLQRRKHKAIRALRNMVPGFQSSVESLHHRQRHSSEKVPYMPLGDNDWGNGDWHGLSRYIDEDDADDHQAWAHIEYARFSTILDCPSVHLVFYWDSPGRVRAEHFETVQTANSAQINGAESPAYGLDLTVRGGSINYGPWTDRLRAELQSVFVPASYRSVKPAKSLQIGEWRQSTTMIIRVDIDEEVTMRVPTRESSKDWRWRGKVTAVRDAVAIRKQQRKRHFRLRRGQKGLVGFDLRPFGWISFSVSSDSSVRYEMGMVANEEGYQNHLQLDLKNTRASSSVNHADLWRCANQKLQCDLSNPLVWNSHHTWSFSVLSEGMDLFMLRDHMFLLTDLITDFTAGQKSEYMTFVPFTYRIKLRFQDWKLLLNANDFNIIDNPCDLDNNVFLILGMQELEGNVDIPMDQFSAPQSSVLFRAHGDNLFLELKTPVWNTLHAFADSVNYGSSKQVDISGSYNYNAGTSSELTDSLFLSIAGGPSKLNLEGFLIRYLMNITENYFGEDLHFRTLEEYQDRLGPDNHLLVEDQRRTVKKDNDLDVVLSIRAENSSIFMPANIYVREESLKIDVMLVEADLRFTNYYMDLQVNSSPIEVAIEKEIIENSKPKKDTTSCQLYISAVSVYGHRLFGAPPTEPTYVCNWDFDVGDIYGECSTRFLGVLMTAINSFVYTFVDEENALPVTREAVLNDITFLRARVAGIQVWAVTEIASFLLETGCINVSFDDWAGQHFSKALKATIPGILLAAIESHQSLRQHGGPNPKTPTLACIQTSIHITNLDRKENFEDHRQLQQDHVKFHDLRTHRTSCLLHTQDPVNASAKDIQWSLDPPAMPVPDLPAALGSDGRIDNHELAEGSHRSRLQPKSFLASHVHPDSTECTQATETSASQDRRGARHQSTDKNRLRAERNVRAHSPPDIETEIKTSGQIKALHSSPWVEPSFSLKKVRPDLTHMPLESYRPDLNDFSVLRGDDAEKDYTDSDEPISHAAIFCSLSDGIRGFCLPQLFPAVVQMLHGLTPSDPQTILDTIQQSTVANIKKLTTIRQGEKIDIALHLPSAAIRLLDIARHHALTPDWSGDQYDLALSHVRVNARVAPIVTKQTQRQPEESVFLVQSSIRDISVLVAEKTKLVTKDVTGLHLSIRNIEFWLSMQDEIRGQLQLSSLQVSTGGSTVDRLSMLAERSRVMFTDIVNAFDGLDQSYPIRHLVYHLSLLNTDATDPTFLSKPSYVLRSASEHIRLADSWKILARFRQKISSQSSEERRDLMEHRSCLFERQEDKARQQIMESIDSWQSWDRDHEACAPLFETIFGKSNHAVETASVVKDLEMSVYIGEIAVVIDPGPKQSDIVLRSGDLNISQRPLLEKEQTGNAQNLVQRSKIKAQVWFAEMSSDLNWNLIELARSVVKQFNISTAMAETSKRRRSSVPGPVSEDFDIMVVAGTDIATMKVRTINLNMYMAAQAIKTSITAQQSGAVSTTSLLLASKNAQLRLASRHGMLFNWKLSSPSIYGLYQRNNRSLNDADTARFAASCVRLRFDMKEDILSVLEVVDLLIKDEITIIQEVLGNLERQTVTAKPQMKPTSLRLIDCHVAFFLNNYKIQFCLLPTLYYRVIGMVARTSIVPLGTSRYAVHIDVKKNKHMLIEPSKGHRSTTAALEVPPLNSRLLITIAEKHVGINARSTLEMVKIEADAVQACVEAGYQTQNIRRFKDCKVMVDRIQSSLDKVQKLAPQKPTPYDTGHQSTKVLLYSGHAVFEGFTIHCSAPSTRGLDYKADLRLGLRETTLKIHNHLRSQTKILNQPHFEIGIRETFISIHRKAGSIARNLGRFGMGLKLRGTTYTGEDGTVTQNYKVLSESIQLDLFSGTIPLVIDLVTFLQGRFTQITTPEDRKKIKPLRRLTLANTDIKLVAAEELDEPSASLASSNIFDTTLTLDLNAIRVRWIILDDNPASFGRVPEDLVFSIRQIDLRTQRESSARLTILDMQLQTVSKKQHDPVTRTANSALLPEMIFNAAHYSTRIDRRFAFQAAGKALDLRLAADGIIPISTLQTSLARATAELRNTEKVQASSNETTTSPITSFLGNKRLASLLIDADFAGAIVKITPRAEKDVDFRESAFSLLKGPKRSKAGRYGQAVQNDGIEEATLRAPGIAVKVEYIDTGRADPTLSTEFRVAASSNTLAPSVVPLILEIYSSVKEIIGEDSSEATKPDIKSPAQKYLSDAASTETDPTAILGRVKLNAGMLVQRQEFSLTCQPIARVAATAQFEDIFVTINTVENGDKERFFSILTAFNKLQVSVQHVYSRESTASFEVDSIVMSLMNSKHVSAKNGISAILNISPMRASLNVKQMQDFLLFREIWYPAELRRQSKPPAPVPKTSESQAYAMQKYHELAATAALPWHAIVSVQELKLEVDFGQSIGKSSFMISKLWASSKKNSDWEQNLCIGFDRIGIDSSGRMSGFIELRDFHVRTSIRWPVSKKSDVRAPLVQASVGFGHLRLKTAFDYQPFAVADVSSFEFLMYNVRPTEDEDSDRLVGILNGGKVQVFCVSAAAAQALSIVQAFERLFQEKRDAFQDSLHELDKLLRRKSIFPSTTTTTAESSTELERKPASTKRESHRLHTDVVVSLKEIDIGAFPNTFFDNQILKIEAVDAQARFAVATINDRLRSGLGMSLGQVRVALSTAGRANTKALGEVEISEVIERATSSRGGIILKVPRLVASMQTWQEPQSYLVEYIFSSTFQGKVDVGWNYSRIRFIRSMWETHSQALAQRLGKPLPPAAVKFTAEPHEEGSEEQRQEKITAVVNVPQSTKFQYVALEPPIIDTPQLRDMGEATPPLEWIGLHRDKLPNVTHSIIIVTLLEVAKEVEEAYTRILGTA